MTSDDIDQTIGTAPGRLTLKLMTGSCCFNEAPEPAQGYFAVAASGYLVYIIFKSIGVIIEDTMMRTMTGVK